MILKKGGILPCPWENWNQLWPKVVRKAKSNDLMKIRIKPYFELKKRYWKRG